MKESEKTKKAIIEFETEMTVMHCGSSDSVVQQGDAPTEVNMSPRGPRTERARSHATELGDASDRVVGERDNDDGYGSTPSSPTGGFFRRLFTTRKHNHGRAMAETAE